MSTTIDIDIHFDGESTFRHGKTKSFVWVDLINDDHEATFWFDKDDAEQVIDDLVDHLQAAKALLSGGEGES